MKPLYHLLVVVVGILLGLSVVDPTLFIGRYSETVLVTNTLLL